MTAEELMKRYSMREHFENGVFVETHYLHDGEGRPASGSIYYYVSPGERTVFHMIDCDEYWLYHLGAPLQVWIAAPDGSAGVHLLGAEEGCEPMIFLRRGAVFAAKSAADAPDGTFLSCITVPRFTDAGLRMFSRDEILAEFPRLSGFYKD